MDSTMDTLVIQIQSSSKSATESINTLVDSLKKLRTELKNVVDESKNLSSLKVNLPSVGVRSGLQKKATIQPMSREDALEKINVSGDLTPLSTLKKSDGTQLQKYRDTMGSLVTVTKKTKNGIDSFTASVKANNPHIKTFSEKIEGLQSVFSSTQVKMAGLITGFVALANKMTDFIGQASSEQEALNLFTVTMGEYAKQGVEWLNKFSNALYLDPVSVMKYMGSFNALVKGLGLGAENSYKMSKNLTQLVYDFSSFKEISIESAYEKLMSAMAGELEPVRNQGVAMSEATLQTLAYSLGIDKLVRNMTEAEKAQLRYIQIMRSTSEWQTDMGRTIVTPANALRVMRQQFVQLGRAIGNVFIPIIMLVMPYIIALTQLITALAKKIADFVSKILGIKIVQDIDYSNLGEISAGIKGIGTSADKTTEKLNTMLAPFDDLNVVQNQSKSGGSGSGLGGSGDDLGVPLPEYNALANLNKTFAEGVENAKAKLKSLLPLVIAVGSAFALWKISSGFISTLSAILNTADILSKVTPMTSAKWTKILGGGLVIAIGSVLATIGLGLGWNAIKTALEENGWDNNSLQKYGISSAILVIGGFIIGAGIALATGTAVLTAGLIGVVVAGIVVALGLIISSIVMYWEEIKKFFGDLPNWFNQNVVTPIISFFTNSFGTIATWLNDTVIQPIWSFIEPVVTNIITIIKSILTTVSMIFKSVFTVISTIFGAVFEVVSTRIKNLIDIIKGIGTAVFTVVGKISEIVLKVVEIIWVLTSTLFSNIFSAISDLANWVYTSFIEPVLLKIKLFVTKLTTIMAIIVTTINDKVIQPLVKLFTNLVTKVINLFKNIGISVSNAFASVFKSVLNGVFVLIETKINGFISALNTGIKVINKIPGVSISKVSKISIPRFDDGGYPTSGDLFFANENGVPEMVGKIGNQTAVANNDQITTSITNALISALNQYDFGGGKAPTTIYIGNRKVYEGYGDYMAEENDRYGTNMIKI